MTRIACLVALVLACTTVSGVAADSDTEADSSEAETQALQAKLEQMKAQMQQMKMKMHLLQMKMQEMKAAEAKTSKTKTPEAKASEGGEGKTPEAKKPEPKMPEWKNPWDMAFGGALMSDYNFRGISASDHRPAVMAYLEPRYNFSNSLQAYSTVSIYSITLPNHVASAIELFAGVRPTFDRLALDFGLWEHWLPGGRCFNPQGPGALCVPGIPTRNVLPAQLSFWEVFAKATYYVDTHFSFGGRVNWTHDVLDSGAEGTYVAGWAKYILPPVVLLPVDIGWFFSAEAGHWFRDASPYPSYSNWNAGLAFTWKQFTLDFRYSDTDRHNCILPVTATVYSNRCGASFIAKLSFDLTKENLK